MGKSYYNIIETLAFVCCHDEGKVKILLKKKKTEPFQGSWILPGDILSNEETFETSIKNTVYENTGVVSKKMIQNYVFSDLNRDPKERIIASVYTVIMQKNMVRTNNNYEMNWFEITELPKMGYDHGKIVKCVFESLAKKIIYNENNIIKDFFPDIFTLREFQSFWEYVNMEKFDRRNFRKKLVSQELVVQVGMEDKSAVGRPSKLYKFTDNLKEGSLV